MSGLGKRFVDAGYDMPKPRIIVDGKPIIEHVISVFSGDHSFVFICSNDHLKETNLEEVLRTSRPNSTIIGIEKHTQGPVYALTHVYDYILDDEEVMISYCDYGMDFDFNNFQNKLREGNFDGAVPCYTGFHPHLLHGNVYAGVRVNEHNVMIDIREKHSFTENPMESHHSVGAYYFRRGSDLKKYHDELLASNIRLNGEAYTSMIYYLYLRDGHNIYVPEVQRFMQWGTPTDLEEYEAWSRYFHKQLGKEKGKTDIPESRERFVKIPYEEKTTEYEKCYTYWENHFTH